MRLREIFDSIFKGFAPTEIAQLMNVSTLKNHSGNYVCFDAEVDA